MGAGAPACCQGILPNNVSDADLAKAIAEISEADRARLTQALARAPAQASGRLKDTPGSVDEAFDTAVAGLDQNDQESLEKALSRARGWLFSLDAIVARSEYKVCPGAAVLDGFEVVGSWQEGIAAAKKLSFSGDSVAHGEYCHNDPNIFSGEHPKGMFKGSNGRFHFNCGEAGCSDGDEILLKETTQPANLGKLQCQLKELGLYELIHDATDTSIDDALKKMDITLLNGLMEASERVVTASLPAALSKPPSFTAEEKADLNKKWCQAESLREAVRDGTTVLLKGSWLIQLSKAGGVIPRRQDLPPEAGWDPEELLGQLAEADHIQHWEHKVPIVALSYCWVKPSHPDPEGEQLKSVSKVLDVCLNGPGWDNDASRRVCIDMAVFWDYGGLYQNKRTKEEQTSFGWGLKHVNLWYAHKMSTVWMLTKVPIGVKPYDERGWPNFERAVATMTKAFHFALDLGLMQDGDETRGYYSLKDQCNSRRSAPMHPSDFRSILGDKSFTNGSDRGFVMNKYNETFEEVMGSAKELVLARLNWGPEEYASVAKCLPYCVNLETLNMNHNPAGNEGMKFIAEVLPSTRIKHLWFHENRLDAEGVDMLVTAAEKMDTAQVIQCNFHKLTQEQKQGFEKRWQGKKEGVFG